MTYEGRAGRDGHVELSPKPLRCGAGHGSDQMRMRESVLIGGLMHKIIIALLAAVTLSAATLPAFAQSCPEGQHYDAVKKKCVPHGQ